MKITLEIPDTMLCAFMNGVVCDETGMRLVSHQLGSEDLTDGNTIKLPREELPDVH